MAHSEEIQSEETNDISLGNHGKWLLFDGQRRFHVARQLGEQYEQ